MKTYSNLPKYLVLAVLAGSAIIILGKITVGDKKPTIANVNVPVLTASMQEGKKLYDENCMTCHGKNTAGTDQGPPFIHPVYRPNHHADQAFVLAALRGVRAHHWPFGNMPPQPQVNETQVLKIIQYVRLIQRANGIQ